MTHGTRSNALLLKDDKVNVVMNDLHALCEEIG